MMDPDANRIPSTKSSFEDNVTVRSSSVTTNGILTPNLTTTLGYVLTRDIILWKVNEEEFEINFPCMLCLIFAIVIGVCGNVCVIYVFGFRFKRNNTNLFTTGLSIYDLITNFLLVFEVFDKRFPMYSGNYKSLCKAIRLFIIITNSSSAFLLLSIAFDRYFKMCKPLKRMSAKTSRRVITAGLIVPLVCVWPMAIFHGPQKKYTVYEDIYGLDCADDDAYVDTITRKVFYSFLVLVIICSIIVIIVLYVLIFLAIRQWKRFGDTFSKTEKEYDSKMFRISLHTGTDTLSSIKEDDDNERLHVGDYSAKSKVSTTTNNHISSPANIQRQNIYSKGVQLKSTSPHNKRKIKHTTFMSQKETNSSSLDHGESLSSPARKDNRSWKSRTRTMSVTTFMFSLVSALYVCSFLPTVTVEALNALSVFNYSELSFTAKQFVVIANISYFLNGSFNPVIYVSCNKNFRNEIMNMFYSN